MSKQLIVCAFLGILVFSNESEFGRDNQKILNGSPATLEEFNYQVSLTNSSKDHFCGGTIIHKRYILTAAHCAYFDNHLERQSNQIFVMAGNLFLDKSNEFIGVMDIIRHNEYDHYATVSKHDIAILKLKTPLQFNAILSKISLNNEKMITSTTCFAAGWGLLSLNGKEPSNKMQCVQLDLITNEKCQERYKEDIVTEALLCAGNETHNFAKGDSGGALRCGNKAVGVISLTSNKAGVYTRISYYYDWIETTTNNWPDSICFYNYCLDHLIDCFPSSLLSNLFIVMFVFIYPIIYFC